MPFTFDANNDLNVNIAAGSVSTSDQINGVKAIVSAANSSTTPLVGGASFTGATVDLTAVPGYTAVQVQVLASQNGTVYIQFSTDTTNWDHTITSIVTAADSASIATGIHGRYVRVVYTNGATTQVGGYFRLQTLLIPTAVSPTVKDLDTPVDGDDNATITHSLITGHTTAGGGSMVDVKVNPSGALTAAVTAADGDVFVRSNAAATFPVTATQGPANATPWNENVPQWGGTVVSAPPAASTPPAGTEVAPVIRPILRKMNELLYTSNIAGGATYTSAWFDSQPTGAVQAFLNYLIPSSGFLSLALRFESSDDQTNITQADRFTPSAGIPGSVAIRISGRYWRVVFINGATQQTSPLISVNTVNSFAPATPAYFSGLAGVGVAAGDGGICIIGNLSAGDGFGSGLASAPINQRMNLQVANMATTGASTGTNWVGIRTPAVFKDKSSATASGDTAVWTPTTGKKFRVMKYMIAVQGLSTTAAGGNVAITLRDATSAILHTFNINVPAVALTGAALLYESNWIDLGNGYLSAVANNVLNVNLGTAFTAGGVDVFVAGTEE